METAFVRATRSVGRVVGTASVCAALASCGGATTVPQADQSAPAGVAGSARQLEGVAAKAASSDAAPSAAPAQIPNTTQPEVIAPTMVIRNGNVTMEVDSLELAITALHQVATSMGGYVGNTSRTTGQFNARAATLELKIPSARYESAVSGLKPIGKIESESSTAEDVGEEYFDISARQANARKLEERLINLLATRTGKLEDVLTVERELARVREEIERYDGRLRYLKSHVATSTLSVTVHERYEVVSGYAGRNVILESFKNAWRIFVSFIAIAISQLGWIIPTAVLVFVGNLLRKRFFPDPKPSVPTPAAPPVDQKRSEG